MVWRDQNMFFFHVIIKCFNVFIDKQYKLAFHVESAQLQ